MEMELKSNGQEFFYNQAMSENKLILGQFAVALLAVLVSNYLIRNFFG